MAYSSSPKISLKIIEKCHISPSLGGNSYSLPLTFLDIPWLLFPPSQPLFFFQLPPTPSFASAVLPKLKLSLISALRLFSPFASRLLAESANRIVLSSDAASSSIPLTFAECDGVDFDYLCKDFVQMNCGDFRQLVPKLESSFGLGGLGIGPLFAIQVTHFPEAHGLSIGLAYHRVVSDERNFNNFIHSWASFCKLGGSLELLNHPVSPVLITRYGTSSVPGETKWRSKPTDVEGKSLIGLEPTFDRAIIIDSNGLEPILLSQLWDSKPESIITKPETSGSDSGLSLVRSTFVMGPIDIGNAKKWILAQCEKKNRAYPLLLSPYVVTCAFLWACLVRAQLKAPAQTCLRKGPMYFGFIAGGITRLSYPVPNNYFGNCVAFGRAVAKREDLLIEDGILVAADEIGQTIKKLDRDVLGEADDWIPDWEPIIGSDLHINVVGSPKVNRYEVDFGWGKPKKIDDISIDVMRGISLTESREMKGGIEIGITLPKSQMSAFSSIFTQGLLDFSL